MAERLVIVGAGGFGREVLDVVRASNDAGRSDFDVLGLLDDARPDDDLLARINISWLGPLSSASSLPPRAGFLIGIGSPSARAAVDKVMSDAGLRAVTVVHPRSSVGSEVSLGAGTIICGGVTLTTNIRFGRHTHVNINATVGHDCVFGDRVTVNPGANISGNVTLANDVTIGTGACVIQGLQVGAGAVVGAGAAVVRSIPPGTIVKGVPARA